MDVDNWHPNSPGTTVLAFTGAGTLNMIPVLNDGTHSEGVSCPPDPSVDTDGDGWGNDFENYLGTDPNDDCPDSENDAAWPPDLNNDTFVDITDLSAATGNCGEEVGNDAPVRQDLGPKLSGGDEFVDTSDFLPITETLGAQCS
jgi:hypothetical protein